MGKETQAFCAALNYIIVGIIWYFLDEKMQKSAFVKFHVKQGIIFVLFAILWGILMSILWALLGWVAVLAVILNIISYLPIILLIVGIINAFGETQRKLPIIGQYERLLTF